MLLLGAAGAPVGAMLARGATADHASRSGPGTSRKTAAAKTGSSGALTAISAAVERGDLRRAEAQLWVLLGRDPSQPEALNLLGIIRGKQQRYPEAEALFRRSIALKPDFLGAYLNLAGTQQASGDLAGEAETYEAALRAIPHNPSLATELAAVHLQQGQFAQSLADLSAFAPQSLPLKSIPVLVMAHLRSGDRQVASSLAATALRRYPNNQELRLALADSFLAAGLASEADKMLGQYRGAGRHTPETAAALYLRGRIELAQGKPGNAEQAWQRALRLNPSSFPVILSLASLAAGRRDYPRALQLLDSAGKLAPDSPDVLRDQVITSLRAGQSAQAEAAATKLVGLGNANPENLYVTAVAAVQLQRWNLAQRLFLQYLPQKPQDAAAHLGLGIAYFNQQELDKARSEFNRCLQLDPAQTEAKFQLALVSRAQGDNSAAISELEQVVAAQPRSARAYSVLGALYLASGEESKAGAALERSADLDPAIPETQYQLNLLYNRLGRPERARQHLAQFEKLQKAAAEAASAAPAKDTAEPGAQGPR